MSLPAPSSRIESFLQSIISGSTTLPYQPESRIEQYLAHIIENGVPVPVATSSQLGGIKVGSGLSVTADGTLSLSIQSADEEEF